MKQIASKQFLYSTLILLIFSPICFASSNSFPSLVVPDCLGVNIHFSGRDQAQVDKISNGGFGFIRMDFTWGSQEREKGVYDFSSRDELLQTLEARGLRPIYILDYGNGLYDNGKPLFSDEGRAAFAAYAKAATEHFKGRGVVWELWNEPSGGPERGGYSPEGYVKLAKAVYTAMKQADPGCILLGPSLAGWNFSWFEDTCKEGLLNYVDGISLHPYGAPKPEDVVEYYDSIRTIIKKYAPKGREYPLVSSEWGYPEFSGGISLDQHSQYIVRSFLTNMLQAVPISIWYDWRDDDRQIKDTRPEMEFHFGVLYNDFKEKPTYYAMKTLTTELKGYAFSRRLQAQSDDDYLLLFSKNGDSRLAAWTVAEPHTISIPVDAKTVTVVSLMGEKKRVEVKDGMLDIDLGESVQYIEPDTQSDRWAAEAAWNITGRVVFQRGMTVLIIKSNTNGLDKDCELLSSGGDLMSIASTLKQVQHGNFVLSRPYVWDGSAKPVIISSLSVEGIDKPLVRTVELDTSELPSVDILPPADGKLFISINRPACNLDDAFSGKLFLSCAKGINFDNNCISYKLLPGQTRQILSVNLKDRPEPMFSFACTLLDKDGYTILRTSPKRYSIVETFSEGKPGETIPGYNTKYTGDDESSASFTYEKSPKGSPFNICARLEYLIPKIWKPMLVSPTEPVSIPDKPKYLRAWVMGDQNRGSTKLRIEDAGGQVFQPNYGFTDFNDWRYMDVDLICKRSNHWGGKNDGRIQYPIKWNSIFVVESVDGKIQGAIHLGPMMLCYD